MKANAYKCQPVRASLPGCSFYGVLLDQQASHFEKNGSFHIGNMEAQSSHNPNLNKYWMGNTCQNSRLEAINSFEEGLQYSLQIHKKDAPLPSYAIRTAQRPLLNETVRRVAERQLDRAPIHDENYKGHLLPIFHISKKGLFYEGQWKARVPHGRGKVYFEGGHYFEGYFDCGEATGRDGLLVFSDGSCYRGEVEGSYFEGQGRFEAASGMIYEGEWRGSKPHGKGKETFPDGNSYEGDFVDGVKEGSGTFQWSDGKVYCGQFKGGKMHGRGRFTKGQQSSFQGQFEQNKKKGKGVLSTPYGVYEGQFSDGELGGRGKFTWKDNRTYCGTFSHGMLNGKGILAFPLGKTFRGSWKSGQNQSLSQLQDE